MMAAFSFSGGASATINGKTYTVDATGEIDSILGSDTMVYITYAPDGTPMEADVNGVIYYLLTDADGSVMAVSDAVGNIVENCGYDAVSGAASCSGNFGQPPIGFEGDINLGNGLILDPYAGLIDTSLIAPVSSDPASGPNSSLGGAAADAGGNPFSLPVGGSCSGQVHASLVFEERQPYVNGTATVYCNEWSFVILILRLAPADANGNPRSLGRQFQYCSGDTMFMICGKNVACPAFGQYTVTVQFFVQFPDGYRGGDSNHSPERILCPWAANVPNT